MKKAILVMLIMTSMSFAQVRYIEVSPWSVYGGFTSMGVEEEIVIETEK